MTDWLMLFIILSSPIWVPLIWVKLRGEKAGDREGDYPEPPKTAPDWGSDDPTESGIPGAEAPAYGPVRSDPRTHVDLQTVKHGWTHRDITYYLRKYLGKEKKSSLVDKKDEQVAEEYDEYR